MPQDQKIEELFQLIASIQDPEQIRISFPAGQFRPPTERSILTGAFHQPLMGCRHFTFNGQQIRQRDLSPYIGNIHTDQSDTQPFTNRLLFYMLPQNPPKGKPFSGILLNISLPLFSFASGIFRRRVYNEIDQTIPIISGGHTP